MKSECCVPFTLFQNKCSRYTRSLRQEAVLLQSTCSITIKAGRLRLKITLLYFYSISQYRIAVYIHLNILKSSEKHLINENWELGDRFKQIPSLMWQYCRDDYRYFPKILMLFHFWSIIITYVDIMIKWVNASIKTSRTVWEVKKSTSLYCTFSDLKSEKNTIYSTSRYPISKTINSLISW